MSGRLTDGPQNTPDGIKQEGEASTQAAIHGPASYPECKHLGQAAVIATEGAQVTYMKTGGFQQMAQSKGCVATPVMGNLMEGPEEGDGEQKDAAGLENTLHLPQHGQGVRAVLQHLCAQGAVDCGSS
jgi:hypothetical protein